MQAIFVQFIFKRIPTYFSDFFLNMSPKFYFLGISTKTKK